LKKTYKNYWQESSKKRTLQDKQSACGGLGRGKKKIKERTMQRRECRQACNQKPIRSIGLKKGERKTKRNVPLQIAQEKKALNPELGVQRERGENQDAADQQSN